MIVGKQVDSVSSRSTFLEEESGDLASKVKSLESQMRNLPNKLKQQIIQEILGKLVQSKQSSQQIPLQISNFSFDPIPISQKDNTLICKNYIQCFNQEYKLDFYAKNEEEIKVVVKYIYGLEKYETFIRKQDLAEERENSIEQFTKILEDGLLETEIFNKKYGKIIRFLKNTSFGMSQYLIKTDKLLKKVNQIVNPSEVLNIKQQIENIKRCCQREFSKLQTQNKRLQLEIENSTLNYQNISHELGTISEKMSENKQKEWQKEVKQMRSEIKSLSKSLNNKLETFSKEVYRNSIIQKQKLQDLNYQNQVLFGQILKNSHFDTQTQFSKDFSFQENRIKHIGENGESHLLGKNCATIKSCTFTFKFKILRCANRKIKIGIADKAEAKKNKQLSKSKLIHSYHNAVQGQIIEAMVQCLEDQVKVTIRKNGLCSFEKAQQDGQEYWMMYICLMNKGDAIEWIP